MISTTLLLWLLGLLATLALACRGRLAACFAALGVLLVALGAEFVGWAWVLIGAGALPLLLAFGFSMMPEKRERARFSLGFLGFLWGTVAAGLLFAGLFWSIAHSALLLKTNAAPPDAALALPAFGVELAGAGPGSATLAAMGVLWLAALVGAGTLAREEES